MQSCIFTPACQDAQATGPADVSRKPGRVLRTRIAEIAHPLFGTDLGLMRDQTFPSGDRATVGFSG